MAIIINKFSKHQVSAQTEILILGTFSPDIPGAPDFFFGRSRIFLWHLLPQCWGVEPLQEAPLSRKKEFMSAYHIDFADIIDAVDMPEEGEGSFDDLFIDSHVHQWRDIIALIDTLPALKAVYFTKKTFSGIPLMRARIKLAADYCDQKGIRFCKLETPSKFYSPEKLQQWKDTIVLQSTCLRV